jgi:hypothetical protein
MRAPRRRRLALIPWSQRASNAFKMRVNRILQQCLQRRRNPFNRLRNQAWSR